MLFTRANGVARVLVSVLDIEFVPDGVKWAHKGLVYNIDIEFEDSEYFAQALAGMDVDRHDKNDGSGNSEERQGHELPSGPVADPQTPGNGVAPSTTVPMSTLRFGSFPAASAPPRLWSDRVDSKDVFEHMLPSLGLAEDLGSPVGRDGFQQVASRSSPTAAGSRFGRSPSGLAAVGAVSPCRDGPALGRGLGQEAPAISPVVMVRVAEPSALSDPLT